jgi:type II secretory pathway pseudopilin PulG
VKRSRGGFTLVESMVTTGLFFVVAVIVLAVLWSVWRGFTYGVAKAQALQAANLLLERVGHDVANSPIARTDEIVTVEGGWRVPHVDLGAVTWTLVRDKKGNPIRVEREGKALKTPGIRQLSISAVTFAGPIAVEIEAADVTGRATVKLRKLIELPRLRQRARYSNWEIDVPPAGGVQS